MVCAPLRAAASAADRPAGPPPTTTTLACAATRTSLAGWRIQSFTLFMRILGNRCCRAIPGRRSVGARRLPFDELALKRRNDQEERAGQGCAHDDGRVQQGGIEGVGG